MPLFEYECRDCSSRFERLTARADADEASCPACGAPEARRLISVIGGMTGRATAPAPSCGQGACGGCR